MQNILKRILTRDQPIDLAVVVVANLMNLIMVPVFLLRTYDFEHPQIVGLIWVAFILVLVVAVIINLKGNREWWAIVFPSLMGIFLVVEVVLDYLVKVDFRSTSFLGPYLLLYYVSILGMVGYAFAMRKRFGFITLASYFLSQMAALYSYFTVGHG